MNIVHSFIVIMFMLTSCAHAQFDYDDTRPYMPLVPLDQLCSMLEIDTVNSEEMTVVNGMIKNVVCPDAAFGSVSVPMLCIDFEAFRPHFRYRVQHNPELEPHETFVVRIRGNQIYVDVLEHFYGDARTIVQNFKKQKYKGYNLPKIWWNVGGRLAVDELAWSYLQPFLRGAITKFDVNLMTMAWGAIANSSWSNDLFLKFLWGTNIIDPHQGLRVQSGGRVSYTPWLTLAVQYCNEHAVRMLRHTHLVELWECQDSRGLYPSNYISCIADNVVREKVSEALW